MLISNQERKEFAENPKYYEEVGSDRMKIKVIRADEVGKAMKEKRQREGKSMIIELRALVLNKKKEFKHKISHSKDRDYGVHYGIFTGMDRFKNHMWYRILLDREQIVINLNDPEDVKKLPVIAMHPSIQGSPMGQYEDPIMYVFDPKEDSMKSLNKLDLIPKVTEFINKLKAKDLIRFARYVNIPVSSEMDIDMIKGRLADMGINDPREFINLVNAKDRNYHEVLTTALEIGEIVDDAEKGFVFNGVYLGASREEVIDKMKNEDGLLNGIILKIQNNDKILIDLIESEEAFNSKSKKVKEQKPKEKRSEEKVAEDNTGVKGLTLE